MASANLNVALKRDWLLANPWLWLGLGIALCGWALAWTLTYREIASDYRVIIVALGLLATGAGAYLRFLDRETLYIQPGVPPLALILRLGMGGLFAAIGVGLSIWFGVACYFGNQPGWYPGVIFLIGLTAAPPALLAARRCLAARSEHERLSADEEVGVAFITGAGVCALGWLALYVPEQWDSWSSMRLFLRALGAVCMFAATVVVISPLARRLALSVLFLLHFAAISTACLAAPPAPWVIAQVWTRLSRPYLEFMYLNNAYHFYAPEPGPSSYLWFRVIFETPEGRDQGLWYKVPELSEDGFIRHPVALEYHRYLVMNESIGAYRAPPPENYFDDKKKEWAWTPFYANRLTLVPQPGDGPVKTITIGKQELSHLRIPLNGYIPPMQQIWIPSESSHQMLSSNARFVARKFATHPSEGWTFKSVKVYRVVHWIPPVLWFENGIPPTDPELYRPFYAGQFNKHGHLIEDQDPYRYWLITSIRQNPNNPDSGIYDFCRLHAGDPRWYRPPGRKEWIEPAVLPWQEKAVPKL
jgi:hypothetical protein